MKSNDEGRRKRGKEEALCQVPQDQGSGQERPVQVRPTVPLSQRKVRPNLVHPSLHYIDCFWITQANPLRFTSFLIYSIHYVYSHDQWITLHIHSWLCVAQCHSQNCLPPNCSDKGQVPTSLPEAKAIPVESTQCPLLTRYDQDPINQSIQTRYCTAG